MSDIASDVKKRYTIQDLMTHLNDTHDEQLTFEYLTFDSDAEFTRWLTQVQADVPCTFHRQTEVDVLTYVRYYCSRSGSRYDQHVGQRKRRLKVQGIAKVGYTCPAHLVVNRTQNDEIQVKYLSKHFCHSNVYEQLGHLRLSQADRDWLTGVLAMVTPLHTVLQRVLNEDEGRLERCHVITAGDLTAIRESLRGRQDNPVDPGVTVKYINSNGVDTEVTADCGTVSHHAFEGLDPEVTVDCVLQQSANGLDPEVTAEYVTVSRSPVNGLELGTTAGIVSHQTINGLEPEVTSQCILKNLDIDSPVILYKRQGTVELEIQPDTHHNQSLPPGYTRATDTWETDDFIFGLMDTSQRRVLRGYGSGDSSVVCVDSTHTTNPKQTCYGTSIKKCVEFHLLTLMVLDGNREPAPVAFLYSNKHCEATFCVFLEAVRQRVRVIRCETLLTDITPQFYNSWRTVMGECTHHLYYSWHVDKSFRESTRRLGKTSDELPTSIYKELRALLGVEDVRVFEESIQDLVQRLQDEPATAAFAKFFTAHYTRCVRAWAHCYRAHLGLDAEKHVERVHGIVRHVFHEGRKRGNLDGAIASLITGLCNVNFENCLSELNARHAEGVGMDVITSESVVGREWGVIRGNEVYTVRRVSEAPCLCDVQCAECHACCDTHVCTCADSSVHGNMCAHIHFICMNSRSFNVDGEGLNGVGEESDTDHRLVDCQNGDWAVERHEVEQLQEEHGSL